MFKLVVLSSQVLIFLSLVSSVLAVPLHVKRANPCFVTGSVALPAEVANGLPALTKTVTCVAGAQAVANVPDVSSGGIKFSSIDFQKSSKSPVGFALSTFATPADPANADLAKLQNQLNVYLAVEAGVRSQPNTSALLGRLKGPKFFLQFQMARVKAARGENLTGGNTVEHQLGKVTKNAVGASASEIAQVKALATQL